MRPGPKTILAAVAVTLVAVVAYFRFVPFAIGGVEVTTGECNYQPPMDTLAQGSWNGSMHQLAIEVPANCAASLERADVQRLGSHLFVRARFGMLDGLAAGCNCGKRLILDIPELPRRTYRVHVYTWP